MKAKDFRKIARQNLEGKWGKAVLIGIVYLIVIWLIGFTMALFSTTPLAILGTILYLLILPPLSFSLAVQYLKLYNGEPIKIFSFIDWSTTNFGKSWKVALHIVKKLIAPIILIVVFAFLAVFSTTAGIVSVIANGPSLSDSILAMGFATIGWIGYTISAIWGVVKAYFYILTPYLLEENKDLTAKEIVNKSQELMKGHRWKLFCLALSFIGWFILSAFTFGIGLLFVIPYMQMAFVAFYKEKAGLLTDEQKQD